MYTEEIKELAAHIQEELVSIRREIHMYPELGSDITRTRNLVIKTLENWGIEVQWLNEEVMTASIQGKYPGKTVLLRADMDALPIREKNETPYKSKCEGMMHACGHDAHTSWLLGAAYILHQLKDRLHGIVKFAFQPCEENGRGIGAAKLIQAGILENPKVDEAVAAHVFPEIPIGKIGVKYDGITGAPSGFNIKIIGKSGHASEPGKCIDPINILNLIYQSIQTLQRGLVLPDHPTVVSVTGMSAGEGIALNVIPEEATLRGTIRSLYNEDNERLGKQIGVIAKAIAKAYGAECEYFYRLYISSCINHKVVTDAITQAAVQILGEESNVIYPPVFMGGDDFSEFSKQVPSCYFLVGVGCPIKGITHPIHNDCFDLDESCLGQTAAIMAQYVMNTCGQ